MRTPRTPEAPNGPRLAGTKRTSVSFSETVYQDAIKVATSTGHRSFSGYVEELMRRDIAAQKLACA